jgi:hypothetical protein
MVLEHLDPVTGFPDDQSPAACGCRPFVTFIHEFWPPICQSSFDIWMNPAHKLPQTGFAHPEPLEPDGNSSGP